MTSESLFEFIYILLDKRQVTAAQMAAHFNVSARTVYRWVDALALAGIPVYTTKGRGGGIAVTENYFLDKTLLTDEEKQSVLASLKAVQALSFRDKSGTDCSAETSAVAKLSRLVASDTDWIEIDFAPWNPKGREIRLLFDLLKTAVLQRRQVCFDYFSMNAKTQRRTVQPWKIVFRGQSWYVYAWCNLRNAPRFFKLDRICNCTLLEDAVTVNLCDISESDRGNPYEGERYEEMQLLRLTLKVKHRAMYRIMDMYQIENVSPCAESSEWSEIQLRLPEADWLVPYLLSFGTELEVLEPAHIRSALVQEIRLMWEKTGGK